MTTYIDKEKFQFITSFEKIEFIKTTGEKGILDFGELTIDERIFLSTFLTYIIQQNNITKKIKTNNLYKILFNFNDTKRTDIIPTYYEAFINNISEFLKSKPHFISYIVDHYDEIIDNKTTIYRTQLNRSEMALLYTFKFQRSHKSLNNVLYIMGVAKANTKTKFLNKISLDRFYKTSPSMSKRRIAEIMSKLNINYTILNGYVYFGNGFNVELNEKDMSKEQLEDNILNSLDKKPPIVKQEKIIENKKQEDDNYSEILLDIKKQNDEKQEKNEEIIKKLKNEWNNYYFENTNNATLLVRKWNKIFDFEKEINNICSKLHVKAELIDKALNNEYFDNKIGGINTKNLIIQELKNLRKSLHLIIQVENAFNKETFLYLGYMYSTHEKFMNLI